MVFMECNEHGYWRVQVDGVGPGVRYYYRLDGERDRPDPASRYQPETVHGLFEVVSRDFVWEDKYWRGLLLDDYVIYEVHIGTLILEGTFRSAIPVLDHLVDLGVTVLELMSVAQFLGRRNWGYDGVLFFAPQSSYGGLDGLKDLV